MRLPLGLRVFVMVFPFKSSLLMLMLFTSHNIPAVRYYASIVSIRSKIFMAIFSRISYQVCFVLFVG